MNVILILLVAITLMIVAISKLKVHPFVAILLTAVVLAIAVGTPLNEVIKLIEGGFSSILASVGLIIIFGALIGTILESTGGALKLADMTARLLGDKHPRLSMLLMGWVVSIPVFCDSGFILLNPIRKGLAAKMRVSPTSMTLALSAGLFTSHVLIPPTPGPVAATGMLGMESYMVWIILLGIVVSLFSLGAAYLFSLWIAKKEAYSMENPDDTTADSYQALLDSFGKLPSAGAALLPILLPIGLMGFASVAMLFVGDGFAADLITFVGKPVVALSLGVVSALPLLRHLPQGGSFTEITNSTLKNVGPIVFITAAGGVLGKVIASTNLVDFIKSDAPVLIHLGILLPFLISAVIKSAQGSSTVAITTTASMMGLFTASDSLMCSLGLQTPFDAALTILAIGAGALTVSHANDSYFWVVTSFGEIEPTKGYRTQTLMTLIMGIAAMVAILLLKLVV